MRNRKRGERAADEAVLRLVQEHAAELLRFARRFSHCADDAHDAYQVSVEILVRRMRVDPPAEPLKWLRTVLRHEALAIRAQRERLVGRFEIDVEREEGRHLEDPFERTIGVERLRQAAEALRRLKPQEVTALVLRAEGLTYKEICARTGWTYTRCNRAVYEGRRAFAARLRDIESGAECERWQPLLSALADGEASAEDLAELRPHLRACASCRATLRDFHAAPARVAALVPPLLALPAVAPAGSLLGPLEPALHALAERISLAALRLQGAFEGISGAKVAAVAASTAAIAGGGVALDQATRAERPAPAARAVAAPVSSASAVAGWSGGPAAALVAGRGGAAGESADGDASSPSRSEFAATDGGAEAEFAARRRTGRDGRAARRGAEFAVARQERNASPAAAGESKPGAAHARRSTLGASSTRAAFPRGGATAPPEFARVPAAAQTPVAPAAVAQTPVAPAGVAQAPVAPAGAPPPEFGGR